MRALLMGFAGLLIASSVAAQQPDYEREKRWADQIVPSVLVGDVVWITQTWPTDIPWLKKVTSKEKREHKFLSIYTKADKPRGAVIVGHGRGWNPDYELYGSLRTKIAEQGYSTLGIQLPVLGPGAKVGDYIPIYPDAEYRYELAAQYLKQQGYDKIAIVSHSLGATMANQYLIRADATPVKAWVFIGIINGLEEMFRIKIPVLDVFGGKDWEITQVGAYERKKQIMKVPGSDQVIVPDALHFFEGREDDLVKVLVTFLDSRFGAPVAAAAPK
ncbi:MAG: alpha/beta hydrolase [Burkholderiales bacterium]